MYINIICIGTFWFLTEKVNSFKFLNCHGNDVIGIVSTENSNPYIILDKKQLTPDAEIELWCESDRPFSKCILSHDNVNKCTALTETTFGFKDCFETPTNKGIVKYQNEVIQNDKQHICIFRIRKANEEGNYFNRYILRIPFSA